MELKKCRLLSTVIIVVSFFVPSIAHRITSPTDLATVSFCKVVATGASTRPFNGRKLFEYVRPQKAQKRGRPFIDFEAAKAESPPRAYEGLLRGEEDDEVGPYQLAMGSYQIRVQWIDMFITGKSKQLLVLLSIYQAPWI